MKELLTWGLVTYTKVPAHVKIVKLLIKELSSTPFDMQDAEQTIRGIETQQGEDDEWEDIEQAGANPLTGLGRDVMDFLNDEGMDNENRRHLDSETHSLIITWFKQITETNLSDINSIYHNELTNEERNVLLKYSNVN